MKCPKCGKTSKETNYCPNCGNKMTKEVKAVNGETLKNKIVCFWNGLNKYNKTIVIALGVCIFFCLISFASGKIVAGILSLIQVGTLGGAGLIKEGKIKTDKKKLDVILPLIAIVLVVPFFGAFSSSANKAEKLNWSEFILSDVLPVPVSDKGTVGYDSDKSLSVTLYNMSKNDFKQYVNECVETGFTVESEQTSNSYYAYSSDGYELSLYFYESSEEMSISLDAPMILETIRWSASQMMDMLPVPKSTLGKIEKDDSTGLSAYIGKMPIDEYNEYVYKCITDSGFNIDSEKSEKSYKAKNDKGYRLTAEYKGNSIVYLQLEEPEYTVNIKVICTENLLFDTYDVEVIVDGISMGTLDHGKTETYESMLTKGKYNIQFVSKDDEDVCGKIELNVVKDADIKIEIKCLSNKIEAVVLTDTEQNREVATDTTDTSEHTTEELKEETTELIIEETEENLDETTEEETEETIYEYVEMVWIPSSGSKYHRYSGCSGMDNPSEVTEEKAKSMGYSPCKRCYG